MKPDRSTETRAHQGAEEPAPPDVDTQTHTWPSLAERLARWIVPERNPAGAIYGLITVGALLAAESGLRDTYPETIGAATIAMVLYWFAHSYSDELGTRLEEHERFSWAELWRAFSRDWAITKGSAVPLLTLLVAWALGASQASAVTAAIWSTVATLIAFELAAGIRSRVRPTDLAFEALVGAGMGTGILLLRALLH